MSQRSAREIKSNSDKDLRVVFGPNGNAWIEEFLGGTGDRTTSPWEKVSPFMTHDEGRKLAERSES